MDRVEKIRTKEKKYHDLCYENYKLFEQGTWLHKPVKTVIELLNYFEDRDKLVVLDLGCGIGRNSIPIAEEIKEKSGKVICVDLLESAIEKLQSNSREYDVDEVIVSKLSDIEKFEIEQLEYDFIVAVSALEHMSSEMALERKLKEMVLGTTIHGVNCVIINSNVKEISLEINIELDPMFEINMTTNDMMNLLDHEYEGWEIHKRLVKQLEFEIDREGIPVRLITDCITFVAKKSK